MRARLQFDPQRLIGVDWSRRNGLTHVWICVIPMLPLEVVFGRDTRLLRGAPRRVSAFGVGGKERTRPFPGE